MKRSYGIGTDILQLFKDKFHGAVVRSVDFLMDGCSFKSVSEVIAHYEIVNTPSRISLSGLESV